MGTFIPVNARRNTILMTRLFTYILEAQKGSDQYKTLADAWSGIISTNAIHELIQSSKKFEKWIYGKNSSGKVRMIEFQLERCVKRLHPVTIYSDTISILKEMSHIFINLLDILKMFFYIMRFIQKLLRDMKEHAFDKQKGNCWYLSAG